MNDIVRNILLGISLAAPLGPSGVAVIQSGLRRGFRRAFLTGLGVTSADATYLLIVYFGLSGLIMIPAMKVLIWTLGAFILLYLGYKSIRQSGRPFDLETSAPPASENPLFVGYLVNIGNPITVVWWLGIFGSLLGAASAGPSRVYALLSSATILVGILFWHFTMSLLSHWGKRYLNERSMKYISIMAGLVLALFGVRFAYYAIVTLWG